VVQMAEWEEWKIAFRTWYSLFKSLEIPFGLTNMPASLQYFINNILRPYLDVYITAYLNDILIYSNNLNNYQNYILKILEVLSEAGLHLKPEKYEFYQ
jgi:hypothetical protein